jgi:hypothetical protein
MEEGAAMSAKKPITEREISSLCARAWRVTDRVERALAQPSLGRRKRASMLAIRREALSILDEIASRLPVGSLA